MATYPAAFTKHTSASGLAISSANNISPRRVCASEANRESISSAIVSEETALVGVGVSKGNGPFGA